MVDVSTGSWDSKVGILTLGDVGGSEFVVVVLATAKSAEDGAGRLVNVGAAVVAVLGVAVIIKTLLLLMGVEGVV